MEKRHFLPLAVPVAAGMLLTGCGDVPAYRAESSQSRHHIGLGAAQPALPPKPPPVDCARAKCVALTFDDGPGAYTQRLLGYLRQARARATFFVLGQNVGGNAAAIRQAVSDGHEIGGHSWSHPDLTTLSGQAVKTQLGRTHQEIERVAGVRPQLFRPPYGATNARIARAAGVPQILWDVDTLDWRYRNSARVARVAVRQARRGSIVLMHDIHRTTVAAVPKVLAGLKRRGFQFAGVSDLLRAKPARPGRPYMHG